MIDPARWRNGLAEALDRLRAHVEGDGPPPRFDARDREALAFVLAEFAKLQKAIN